MGIVDFLATISVGLLGALAVQLITFLVSLRLKRVDVVDIAWGLSFTVVIVALWMYEPHVSAVTILVDSLVIVWALRLSSHILARFKRSTQQDERYTQLMKNWSADYHGAQVFIKIFVLQALLATLVSLPVIVVHAYHPGFSWLVVLGAVLWLIGFIFESVADWQLKQFLAQPKRAELMTEGLWKYSRHPNYFGEVTMWWGIALIACTTPLWWLGAFGAAAITLLIRFVSGVPLAEARSVSKKGWTAYQKRTSVLVPWSPKS